MLAIIGMVSSGKDFSPDPCAKIVPPVSTIRRNALRPVLNPVTQPEAPSELGIVVAGHSAKEVGSRVMYKAHRDALLVVDGRETIVLAELAELLALTQFFSTVDDEHRRGDWWIANLH
jgi:hypothetical protein